MKLFHTTDHSPAPVDPKTFTGNATLARMDGVVDEPVVNVYRVAFQPKARTAWHTHSGPQLLLVVEGRCRLQKDGEPIQEIDTGGTVCIGPGEKHWHGAAAEGPMTHIAVNINITTTWLEQVTDAQYDGRS